MDGGRSKSKTTDTKRHRLTALFSLPTQFNQRLLIGSDWYFGFQTPWTPQVSAGIVDQLFIPALASWPATFCFIYRFVCWWLSATLIDIRTFSGQHSWFLLVLAYSICLLKAANVDETNGSLGDLAVWIKRKKEQNLLPAMAETHVLEVWLLPGSLYYFLLSLVLSFLQTFQQQAWLMHSMGL